MLTNQCTTPVLNFIYYQRCIANSKTFQIVFTFTDNIIFDIITELPILYAIVNRKS